MSEKEIVYVLYDGKTMHKIPGRVRQCLIEEEVRKILNKSFSEFNEEMSRNIKQISDMRTENEILRREICKLSHIGRKELNQVINFLSPKRWEVPKHWIKKTLKQINK